MRRDARPCPAAGLFALVLLLAGCHADCVDSGQARHAPPVELGTPTYVAPMVRVKLPGQAGAEEANLLAERGLSRVVSLDADNVTIEQVIDFCREATGVNIAVNWPTLELVGVDQDSLVSAHLVNVSAAKLLGLMLDQVSADAFDDDKLSYDVHEGIVRISTRRELKHYTETRIYDVSWLLGDQEKLNAMLYGDHAFAEKLMTMMKAGAWMPKPVPAFDLNSALSCTNSGGSTSTREAGGDSQGGLFGVKKKDKEDVSYYVLSREERIDIVRDLIRSTVGDPDDWIDARYTMTELNQQLVIVATRGDHMRIEALLNGLREAQVVHFQRQARLIEVFLILKEAEAYRLKQQYPQALRKIDQALRVDPDNAEALALRQIIGQARAR